MKLKQLIRPSLFFLVSVFGCSDDEPEEITPAVVITTTDFAATIDEDPTEGQILGKITGTASEGEVSFSLTSQDPEDAMSIDANNGELKVNDISAFDFDIRTKVTALVAVKSGNTSKEAKVTITITDIPVVVTTTDFTASVEENPEAGTSLGKITGSASEGSVAFSITSQEVADALSIDTKTGELKVNKVSAFDFETRTTLTATVTVKGGSDTKEAKVLLTITDMPDVITFTDFVKSVDENPTNNQILGLIGATATEGDLEYSLTSQAIEGAIAVNIATGEISVADATLFDFEVNPTIAAVVKATAGNATENIDITITLNDVSESISWTKKVVSGSSYPGVELAQVVSFKGKIFVIGGIQSGNVLSNSIWSTQDGISWTEEASSADFTTRYHHQVIEFNDKLWLIGGYDGSGKNDVWTSTDGVAWTEVSSPAPLSGRTGHRVTVFNNKIWIVAGLAPGLNYKNDVYSSSDGNSWTLETSSAAFDARSKHTLTVFNNKLWVIGGTKSGNVRLNDVWSSADGKTWKEETQSTTRFTAREQHEAIVYDNKLWLIGGSTSTLNNEVWTSSDGANWGEENVSGVHFEVRKAHQTVLFDDQLWLIGGIDNSIFPSTYYTDSWVLD